MKKGISAVLATVLIVVITVAIIGLAYAWSVDLFGQVTDTSDDQVDGLINQMSEIRIVDAVASDDDGACWLDFDVKNTGTLTIDEDALTFFFDDEIKATNGDSIAAGDIESFGFAIDSGASNPELKIAGAGDTVTADIDVSDCM